MLFKGGRRDWVCMDNPAEFIGPVCASGKSEQKRAEQKRPFSVSGFRQS
jgi:hypothetical protein